MIHVSAALKGKTYRHPVRPRTITLTIRPDRRSTCVAKRSDPEFTRNFFGMSDVRFVVMVLHKFMPSIEVHAR